MAEFPQPWLDDAAPTAEPRTGSGIQTREKLGDEYMRCDTTAVKDSMAHTLQLLAGTGAPGWGIYRLQDMADADTPQSVTVELASPLADAFWLGFGDVAADRWYWHHVTGATGNDTVDVPSGLTMITPAGTAFAAIVIWDDATRIVRVSLAVDIDGEAPVASFQPDKTYGNNPVTVNLDASASFDRDAGTIVSYEWDWEGDGVFDLTEADPLADVTYTEPSDNLLTLRVTDNHGNTDIATQMITIQGWCKTWGTPSWEVFNDLWVDSHGDIYAAGTTIVNDVDWLVAKYNRYGQLQWKFAFGGNGEDRAYAVGGVDGYLYVTGFTHFDDSSFPTDICLIKLTLDGGIIWQKTYDLNYIEEARALAIGDDGSIYLAGETSDSWEPTEPFLMRIDAGGAVVWAKSWLGGEGQGASDVKLSSSNELLVCGYAWNETRGDDVLLLRFSTTGVLNLERSWGQAGDVDEYANSLAQDYAGNIFLVGSSRDASSTDALILKCNSSGDYQWATTIATANTEYAADLLTSGTMFLPVKIYVLGNWAISGIGNPQSPYLWRFDANGALEWQRVWKSSADQAARGMLRGHNGAFVIAGEGDNSSGYWNTSALTSAAGTGVAQTVAGTITDYPINAVDSNGTVTTLDAGTENTGGGNSDGLVMSYFTNSL